MTEFVAEIGANHNGDINRALDLIAAAADAGCSGVKLQYFGAKGLYAAGIKPNPKGFPSTWLPRLKLRTEAVGLKFGCTVFDQPSVQWVAPHVDFLKVSSYSLLDETLIRAVRDTGKPAVVATGMASIAEIEAACFAWPISTWRDRLTLLHCVSKYPVDATDCHLSNIGLLRRTFACDVGWSDHSADRDVVKRAASRWRSQMIECHFDLRDCEGAEFSGGHCWTPNQLRDTISDVRRGERADGIVGKPIAIEEDERLWRADPVDGLRPSKELRARWTDSRTTSS